jgi:hypothetical protein
MDNSIKEIRNSTLLKSLPLEIENMIFAYLEDECEYCNTKYKTCKKGWSYSFDLRYTANFRNEMCDVEYREVECLLTPRDYTIFWEEGGIYIYPDLYPPKFYLFCEFYEYFLKKNPKDINIHKLKGFLHWEEAYYDE